MTWGWVIIPRSTYEAPRDCDKTLRAQHRHERKRTSLKQNMQQTPRRQWCAAGQGRIVGLPDTVKCCRVAKKCEERKEALRFGYQEATVIRNQIT